MLAAICPVYGPPEAVRVETLPDPVAGPGEVLIAVRASTVSAADHRIRGMDLPRGFGLIGRAVFGWRGPRRPILGTDLAGTIVALGAGVSGWQVGQRVLALRGARMGGHAMLVAMKADAAIAALPEGMDEADAVALAFGGTAALFFLRDRARLAAGEAVLVTGAGGAVGSAAIQIAQAMGARVTALASAEKAPALQGLGAQDFIASDLLSEAEGRRWDVVVDCAGIASRARARGWLAPGGRLCQVVADLPAMLAGAVLPLGQGRRVLGGTAPERAADLRELLDMAKAGRLRPLIGARLPLARIVEAHRIAASRHKLGSTVIEMPLPEGAA